MGTASGIWLLRFTAAAGSAAILLGNGDGTFQPAPGSPVAVEAWPNRVAVGDFNGDGIADVLVAAQTNGQTMNILLGKGDGTFVQMATGSAQLPCCSSTVLGDFNGDGVTDILSSSFYDNTVQVLFGQLIQSSATVTGVAPTGPGTHLVVASYPGDTNFGSSESGTTPLQAQAAAPVFNPTSLNFGTVAVGVTSPVKTVTLKNSGKANLTITAIAITGTNSGDFPETSTCGSSLAAGASCTIKVKFKPSARGARSASVSTTDNAAGNPQKVPLSGTGTTAKLAPTPLSFGTLAVGLTSVVKKVTLTNVGTTALSITSIAVTGAEAGDFPETGTTCGRSLAAAASCTVSLTFNPSTTGSHSANLTVTDNAGGSPQHVPLSGTGTTAGLSATSLSFGSVKVGTTSAGISSNQAPHRT